MTEKFKSLLEKRRGSNSEFEMLKKDLHEKIARMNEYNRDARDRLQIAEQYLHMQTPFICPTLTAL